MPDKTATKENRLLQYAVLAAILILAAIFVKTLMDAFKAPDYTGFVTVKPASGGTTLKGGGELNTAFTNTGPRSINVITDRVTARTTHGTCTNVQIYANQNAEPAVENIQVGAGRNFKLTAKCPEGTPNTYYRLKVIIPYRVDETDVTSTVTEIGEIQGRYR